MSTVKIIDMQMNHIQNPVGYDLQTQTFSWKYDASGDCRDSIDVSRVMIADDADFLSVIHDSGFDKSIIGVAYPLQLELAPRTRYFWKVETMLTSGQVIESEVSYFETGKLSEAWKGKWIGICNTKNASPIIRKTFAVTKPVKSARAYMTGLGLYECYVNGHLQNDGFLQPGFNNYKFWIQYRTLDLTDAIRQGENVLAFLLGDGWYKGRFGVNGGFENNFGEHLHILCEIHICYEDGTEEVVGSDESFLYTDGPVRFSNIYDGEIYDALSEPAGWMQPGYNDIASWKPVELLIPENFEKLTESFSVPVVVKEKIKPAALFSGPAGEMILDMGQNMTGWLTFQDMLHSGQQVTCKFAELLKDGAICTTNLLTAKAEFTYMSNGQGSLVRPHFTYYGFWYVQLIGFPESVKAEDFEGWNLYSDLETTGHIETGNDDLNQLISNAFWSQRDNFLEHPTDCPQRAERLGWTGDAQIYYKTASYFMNTSAFYRKYLKDVNEEQAHKNGLVPFIIPKIAGRGFEEPKEDECSAAWSDVATVVPWMSYVYYGDKNLLAEQYGGMKAWVDYMILQDEANGGRYLWQSGFHFGDWLALDNPEPGPFGKTNPFYIASCFYHYSVGLLAKAAAVLDKKDDAEQYEIRAQKIREAILKEYFTEDEMCRIDTQTAYALAIYMDIVSERGIMANGEQLVKKIRANGGHLDTGFVGTPYLCLALTKSGNHEAACELLMKDDYPSWLYEVKQGATTIWEAWDALDENGYLTAEVSLNHYAYGSVVEWIFAELCGIKPIEDCPGFRMALIAPKPSRLIGKAKASVSTPVGIYEADWHYQDDATVCVKVCVPFAGKARIKLPDSETEREVGAGCYEFIYQEGGKENEN